MGFDVAYPYALLLFPLGAALVYLIDRRCGHKGRKARVTRLARLATLLALVLAIAGASVYGRSDLKAVWVLVDASDSARAVRGEMDRALQDGLAQVPPDTQVGVIAFGKDAMVDSALSRAPTYGGRTALVDGSATDLAGALQLAQALIPQQAAGRVVLLTDGRADAPSLAPLSARGVAVDARILGGEALPDVQVTRLDMPSAAYQGQSFSVTVQLNANLDTDATLALYAGGQAVATRQVHVRKGENTFAFSDVARVPGTVAYQVRVSAQGDQVAPNDVAGAYMVVTGQPSVLVVEGKAGAADNLEAMLSAVGMACRRVSPAMLGGSAQSLSAYDAVMLVNVGAHQLGEAQLAALDGAVRALGRGLAVFGGDNAYALGGYRGSDLEKMLPVTIDVKDKLHMPSLALMLVIDKSGSMTDGQFGVSRLDMAKEGAMRAVEMLTPRDMAGVIAFDDAAKWVVPLSYVSDVGRLVGDIGTIRPGGGTAYYTALLGAYTALSQSDAPQRHVIFLTDGEPGDGGYDDIVRAMAGEGITLTTVAVGAGANAVEMKRLADLGGGRVYVTNEFDDIPSIFAKETYLASGSYVVNRTFAPQMVERGPLTDYQAIPLLDGYLATTDKPLGHLALVSDADEPILAWWQYGAGKVLCWTSDVAGGWTADYLGWDQAAAFFGGMAAFVLPQRVQQGSLAVEGGALTYTAGEGATAGDYRARVLTPEGAAQALPLRQVADGVYQAAWPYAQVGAYAISVEGDGVALLEGGHVTSYSGEYDLDDGARPQALQQAVDRAGGRVLGPDDALIVPPDNKVRASRDMGDALLAAALALFVLDVALRRLGWDKWLARPQKKRARPADAGRRPGPKAPPPGPGADSAQQLLDAMKGRKKL